MHLMSYKEFGEKHKSKHWSHKECLKKWHEYKRKYMKMHPSRHHSSYY